MGDKAEAKEQDKDEGFEVPSAKTLPPAPQVVPVSLRDTPWLPRLTVG
jgi:hypothetical protein